MQIGDSSQLISWFYSAFNLFGRAPNFGLQLPPTVSGGLSGGRRRESDPEIATEVDDRSVPPIIVAVAHGVHELERLRQNGLDAAFIDQAK